MCREPLSEGQLVPELGGILSIIYKSDRHEQLYHTEVGLPYGIKGGTFY